MPAVSLSVAKLRDLNAALHKLPKDTNETHWVITDPGGKHAIACGVNLPITIEITGHVGYYCGGMNSQATIVISGNAGVGFTRAGSRVPMEWSALSTAVPLTERFVPFAVSI